MNFQFNKIGLILFISFITFNVFSQTTIISSSATTSPNGSFENATSTFAANGWTVVNNATNQWFVGTTAFNAGAKGAYIGTATGNNNYTNNTSQVSHFYRDVTFPAGETCITLSFNWKGNGESGFDFLKVYLTNTTTAVTAGTQQSAANQLGTEYSMQSTWQTVTITIPAANAGTTKRLIFSWRNDASFGTNPAAAVDNISLISSLPPTPACASYVSPANSSSVCFAGGTLSWNSVATPTCGSVSYDVYFNAGTTASVVASAGQVGTTYATGALTASTTYAWKIVPKNGSVSATGCSTYTFTTNAPTAPVCASYISPTNGAIICPSSQVLSWNAVASPTCGTITYDVYLDAGLTATTVVSANQVGTTYNTVALSAGIYTWKIVPKNGSASAASCSSYSFTISGIANDLPCNAVNITLGGIASADNSCSGNSGEPTTPTCWTTGNVNTVWFSFTAPASGNVKIRTAPGTLLNTQIATYSGTCGPTMTMLTSGCNTDAPNCGVNPVLLSELSLTGLTSGATYYIAVDGELDLVGTFAITVIDASSSYPSTSGQDCSSPNTICTPTVQIGDPGNQGVGFTCDDPGGASNCTGGERGSVWYKINIANSGNLNFVITPNDYVASNPFTETDYDFIIWKVSGTGATSCAGIATGTAVPVACNYTWLGFCGVYTGGNAPAGNNAFYNNSFEPTINAVAGDVYYLLVENFSGSTKGVSVDFSSSAAGVINYSTTTTISWTGGANTTTWTASSNWGGCSLPSCTNDAVISTISSFQPLISSTMGTVSVNNFTVDPGAVLTLGPNSVLKICGNFTNNGTISADPTSTILFSDDATHSISGTFSASSKLGNLTITDAAGGLNCRVIVNTTLELKGSLTTSNATSIFDLNGKNLLIGGDIINAAGANTFSNTTGSTITFNGTSAQVYNPNAILATPSLTLNNVVVNHTGTGVSLSTTNTPNMILGTSGALTLTNGIIITPNNQEVTLMNTALAAVGAGSTISYVQGNLRRYLAAGALGLFNFPVGHATPGYERATVDFKTGAAAGAINLVARFDAWGGAWTQPAAPNWVDCASSYNDPYLNNGYWSIDASSPSSGLYDLTLYNRGYSNATSYFTIAKSPSSSPSWTLNGNCAASSVTSVQRTSMSGFSKFATIQGSAPLPVELIYFNAVSEGIYNNIAWKSAVEVDFKHYELESSEDGINFTKIATVNPLGNLTSTNNYNYLDFNYFKPITYYRLKMVDLDNTFNYSQIVSVEYGKNSNSQIIVFPNPANNELYISLIAPSHKEGVIEIRDLLGRTIYEQKINLSQGVENTYINTTDFTSGTYIVNITYDDKKSENIKIIINNRN